MLRLMRVLVGVMGLVLISGQVGATAQALDQVAASVQRPQLVTPIASPAPQPEARAASRTGSAGAPPSGNGPGAAKKMSEVLGEIVWLMSQSARSSGRCAPGHKQFFICDLEWPAAQAAKGIS